MMLNEQEKNSIKNTVCDHNLTKLSQKKNHETAIEKETYEKKIREHWKRVIHI